MKNILLIGEGEAKIWHTKRPPIKVGVNRWFGHMVLSHNFRAVGKPSEKAMISGAIKPAV